jgi:uncharacterized protein
MTLEQLKSLPIENLLEIAKGLGLELPEGLERLFVMEEIVEALDEDSCEREENQGPVLSMGEKKYQLTVSEGMGRVSDEDALVPEQYADARIRLLVRDPFWIYAYWDLRESDIHPQGTELSSSLSLRIRCYEGSGKGAKEKECFDVPVQETDRSWYVNVSEGGLYYSAELMARDRVSERSLARSATVRVPRGVVSDCVSESRGDFDRMLEISGLMDLGIEPRTDRGNA